MTHKRINEIVLKFASLLVETTQYEAGIMQLQWLQRSIGVWLRFPIIPLFKKNRTCRIEILMLYM